jgi:hypothetical protein
MSPRLASLRAAGIVGHVRRPVAGGDDVAPLLYLLDLLLVRDVEVVGREHPPLLRLPLRRRPARTLLRWEELLGVDIGVPVRRVEVIIVRFVPIVRRARVVAHIRF